MPVPAVRSKWHQWMYVALQKFHSTQSQVSYLDVSTMNLHPKKSRLNTNSSFQRAKLSNKRNKRTSDQPELLPHLHRISGKIYLIMTWTEDRSITAMLDIQSFPGGSSFHPVRSLPHSWPKCQSTVSSSSSLVRDAENKMPRPHWKGWMPCGTDPPEIQSVPGMFIAQQLVPAGPANFPPQCPSLRYSPGLCNAGCALGMKM